MIKRCKLILLLVLTALMLSGCGYWIVEDAPVQVGSSQMEPEIRGR